MGAGGGKSKASGGAGLPQELTNIITGFWGETTPLRQTWQNMALSALLGQGWPGAPGGEGAAATTAGAGQTAATPAASTGPPSGWLPFEGAYYDPKYWSLEERDSGPQMIQNPYKRGGLDSIWRPGATATTSAGESTTTAPSTGGLGVTIPIISQAIERSKQATSQTLRSLDEDLARYGMAGTPYGVGQRTSAMMQGAQKTAQVPYDIISQLFLGQIPGYTQGSAQSVMGSLGAGKESSESSKGMNFFGGAK